MNSMLAIGLGLAGFIVFAQCYVLVLTISRVIKMPLRAALVTSVQRSAMGDSAAVLDSEAHRLEQLGFRHVQSLRGRSPVAAEGMPHHFGDVYFHPQHGVHAQLVLAGAPSPHKLCDVIMSNSFTDGATLMTVNGIGASLFPFPSNVTLVDALQEGDCAAQLACHLAARALFKAEAAAPEGFLDHAKAFARTSLPRLAAEKQVYRRGGADADPVYGFRPGVAVRLAWRQFKATRLPSTARRKPAPGVTAVGPDAGADVLSRRAHATVLAQRAAFVRTLCMLRGLSAPAWFRRASFVLSAGLFLGIGAWLWGLAGAVTIGAVVLLHEAGHWAAMKLSGFRDVQVFFVPGMGGATSGEKHEAPPLTHLLVFLAGPMPGLLLALAVLAWAAGAPQQQDAPWYPPLLAAAFVSLLINALNLLPALPLDGGRVVEMFVTGRLPWLRFGFAVASGLALLGAGVYTGDTVLQVIGIAMLFASQHHFQVARAAALLLKSGMGGAGAASFTSASRQLHAFLERPAFAGWSYQTKVSVGLALLPRLRGRLPGLAESAAGLAIYAGCALLPLAAVAVLAVSRPAEMTGAFQAAASSMAAKPAVRAQVGREAGRDAGKDAGKGASTQESKAAEAAWERDERQRRAQREAAIAGATEPGARIAVLMRAIDDAAEHDETDDAIRFARLLYAATDPEGSRERAHAALLLARSLAERDQSAAADAEIDNLLREGDFILRGRIADKTEREDVLLLGELFQLRANLNDPGQRFAAVQELVTLYGTYLAPSDVLLAQARRDLAQALHGKGLFAEAEHDMRAMFAALPPASPEPAALVLRRDMAWMLLAYGKYDEAERLVTEQRAAGAVPNGYRLDLLPMQWLIARHRGDWKAARKHALELDEMLENTQLHTQLHTQQAWQSAAPVRWLAGLFKRRPVTDYRARLMLIEAERALGNEAAAAALVAQAQGLASAQPAPGPRACKLQPGGGAWRGSFELALLAIERRELGCAPAAP